MPENNRLPNHNWHVVYTDYLDRIISGHATFYTAQECADAIAWDQAQYDHWSGHAMWIEAVQSVPTLSRSRLDKVLKANA